MLGLLRHYFDLVKVVQLLSSVQRPPSISLHLHNLADLFRAFIDPCEVIELHFVAPQAETRCIIHLVIGG